MRSAVSARPLRAPCVEMKYSTTDRPSRKDALMGRGMVSFLAFDTSPRIPAICRICMKLPRAPESTIMKIGFVFEKFACIASATSLVALVQMEMSSWLRSSLVTRPRSYCFWILSAWAS